MKPNKTQLLLFTIIRIHSSVAIMRILILYDFFPFIYLKDRFCWVKSSNPRVQPRNTRNPTYQRQQTCFHFLFNIPGQLPNIYLIINPSQHYSQNLQRWNTTVSSVKRHLGPLKNWRYTRVTTMARSNFPALSVNNLLKIQVT